MEGLNYKVTKYLTLLYSDSKPFLNTETIRRLLPTEYKSIIARSNRALVNPVTVVSVLKNGVPRNSAYCPFELKVSFSFKNNCCIEVLVLTSDATSWVKFCSSLEESSLCIVYMTIKVLYRPVQNTLG